ncbi:MAG: arginine--tRNA ligase [Alphaproteobacteria bacterium]|nr:arginine--tRNA ligase [Alphaproteobacteria bacterium]
MNLFNTIRDSIEAALRDMIAEGVLPEGVPLDRFTVEPPRDPSHGDIATNAAMTLAKPAGRKPRDIAEALTAKLANATGVEKAEVAGPGFINLTLGIAAWQGQIADILAAGADYGDSDQGQGRKVNVEYVSANPTGPLTAGHARGAVFGDALAGLLEKAGWDVTREYYINDAGNQVDILARSTHLRYREALGETIPEIPAGYYPGEYLKDVGQALADRDGPKWRDLDESAWLVPIRAFATEFLMSEVKKDLALLGIKHDLFTSERSFVEAGGVDRVMATLEGLGSLYVGVLEPPKGKKPDDWEPRPQTLFKSTDYGDDVDRAIKKSDGSYTYFANDIAYHLDKYRRGFAEMIDILGADHGGYVKRMQAAVKAITEGEGTLDVKLCQIVKMYDQGREVRMSKRAGTFITLREIIETVGKDVVRFIMLTRRNDQTLDFDFQAVQEKSRDNPVFYVQYASARGHSVFRQASEAFPDADFGLDALKGADAALLSDESELALVKHLAGWPRLVESAAHAHEPHRVAFYLQDMVAAFHALWNRGKDEPALRMVQGEDLPLTLARLALVQAMLFVLQSGLDVIGVEPVKEM